MKLNAVAERIQSTFSGVNDWGILLGVSLFLLSAGPGLALDGIDLNEPAETPSADECSNLVQIKYPFLGCPDGEIGLADWNASWENSRQIPLGSKLVEGNGYWGSELNRD